VARTSASPSATSPPSGPGRPHRAGDHLSRRATDHDRADHDSAGRHAAPNLPSRRPCPADVAATLPDSRSATLIAGFRTSRFRLYYCRTAGGQLYYRGISRADAAKATTLPARRIAGGFEARGLEEGSVFVFRVAQSRLFVIQDGKQIFVDPIIATL
jgi:hypothetical protein